VDLGGGELIIILIVVLLLFGGAKLPQLARSIGQAKSEFEKGLRGEGAPKRDTDDQPAAHQPPSDASDS
jgi:sec-independent protein translocase protein TatA